MDPSEIHSTSRLPKPLDEGTSPELNEKEKGVYSSDAEFPSVEVEVEQLPHISSDDEKMSSSEPSEDYKPHYYDNPDGRSIVPPSEAHHYYKTAIYHPDFSSSPHKRKFSENDEERYAENDGKSSDNGEKFSENDGRYAENEKKSSDYSEEQFSENGEQRYDENDEKSSENESSSGHVDKRNFSRAEEREHHSSKASTVPIISETNDMVIVTLKAVTKKTIIRILDNEAKISCEVKYRQKRKHEMSDNVKWVHERKFTKTCKDVIITPKVPKTETSKKPSIDVFFCSNGSDDSHSDEENRFYASKVYNIDYDHVPIHILTDIFIEDQMKVFSLNKKDSVEEMKTHEEEKRNF